ncbi:MAG TPA: hypothetical protein VIR65_08290 [Rhizorhapis sp.]
MTHHTHRSIILACLLALPSCGSNDNDPGPGGVTVGEAEALNQAAEMLDTPALPNAGDGAMVDLTEGSAGNGAAEAPE